MEKRKKSKGGGKTAGEREIRSGEEWEDKGEEEDTAGGKRERVRETRVESTESSPGL